MGVLVEIVVQSAEDAVAAELGGAGRLELCSGLGLGGLTPSLGLVRAVRRHTSLPIIAMVRPRPGGFLYSATEFEAMLDDIPELLAAGADGVVLGVLTDQCEIDLPRCRALVERAEGKPVVFHRAFDATLDPSSALEALIASGFHRVLTSGQAAKALEGADLLRDLRTGAAGRIEILPGGGIRAENVVEVVHRTGTNQVHLAPLSESTDPYLPGPRPNFGAHGRILESAVRNVMDALTSAETEATSDQTES